MLYFLSNDGWTSNHKHFWKGHNEGAQLITTDYKGAGRIYGKIHVNFLK
jgi:hypothetical protein